MPFEPLEPEIVFSHFLQSFHNPVLDVFFSAVTLLGHPGFWILLAAFYFWKGDERKSFSIAAIILFASALVGIIKPLTGRVRPAEPEFRVLATDVESPLSMPSGHATTVSGILGYFWEKFSQQGKLIGAIIVVLVALSRIYLGAHFLGDVIAGSLFGFVIGRVLHYFEAHIPSLKKTQKKIIEETGIVSFVAFGVIVSAYFGSFAFASLIFGFFAGLLTFKLFGFDSEKISGKPLVAKAIVGFAGVLAFVGIGFALSLEPEGYFAAGAWITLIYPLAYARFVKVERQTIRKSRWQIA